MIPPEILFSEERPRFKLKTRSITAMHIVIKRNDRANKHVWSTLPCRPKPRRVAAISNATRSHVARTGSRNTLAATAGSVPGTAGLRAGERLRIGAREQECDASIAAAVVVVAIVIPVFFSSKIALYALASSVSEGSLHHSRRVGAYAYPPALVVVVVRDGCRCRTWQRRAAGRAGRRRSCGGKRRTRAPRHERRSLVRLASER
jgi:hypothetical protein